MSYSMACIKLSIKFKNSVLSVFVVVVFRKKLFDVNERHLLICNIFVKEVSKHPLLDVVRCACTSMVRSDALFCTVLYFMLQYCLVDQYCEPLCMAVQSVLIICVFEHSVITNFNSACPAIQRGQGSGFLSEGSSWLTTCMSEQRRFWRDCADAQARLNLRCSHRQ